MSVKSASKRKASNDSDSDYGKITKGQHKRVQIYFDVDELTKERLETLEKQLESSADYAAFFRLMGGVFDVDNIYKLEKVLVYLENLKLSKTKYRELVSSLNEPEDLTTEVKHILKGFQSLDKEGIMDAKRKLDDQQELLDLYNRELTYELEVGSVANPDRRLIKIFIPAIKALNAAQMNNDSQNESEEVAISLFLPPPVVSDAELDNNYITEKNKREMERNIGKIRDNVPKTIRFRPAKAPVMVVSTSSSSSSSSSSEITPLMGDNSGDL